MARRTIRARRASPYLLYLVIAFALLTVICAIGWALAYSNRNQDLANTFGLDRVQRAAESKADPFREVFDKADYQGQGATLVDILDSRNRLAAEYRSEIQRLTAQLMGDPYSTKQGAELRQSVSDVVKSTSGIMAQASETLQKSYQVGAETAGEIKMTSMQAAIDALAKRIMTLVEVVKQDGQTASGLQTQIKGLQGQLDVAKTEYARQIKQLQDNLTDEKTRLTTARDSALSVAKQADEDKQRAMDRLIAERRDWAEARKKLDDKIGRLGNDLKDLADQTKPFREVPTETGVDGHVISVAEQGVIAYADLGKKDGVLLGMPFSIFSPRELGRPKPEPKARCRIVKIMANSCEIRIYQTQLENPVVTGDVLYSPIYDRERRLRFALVGKMDIEQNGVDNTEQLKALIQEFGGRIDPMLTVQADYLVLGEEPSVPPSPGAGASPMERQVYEEARKKFIEYSEAKSKAESFGIPILSLNRFLGLVGIAGQQ
jgi:hypothetical protein